MRKNLLSLFVLFVAVMTMTAQTVRAASGDTYVVDCNGGGDYTTIFAAVSAATGGETIFIKNGEYTETVQISIGSKQLTFTGESQDGVIIKSGNNNLFYTTESGYTSIVISNLTFRDISMTGSHTPIYIAGDGDVTIENCTFDNCASLYGAMRIFTSGSATIDKCTFLNTKSSTGSYSSAIYFSDSSTSDYTIKNTVIDGSSISSTSTAGYIYGAIYNGKTDGTVTLDSVTIRNCNLDKASGLITTKGNMVIKNSTFEDNYVYRDLIIAGFIFVSGAKTVTIESSLIQNNTDPNYFLSSNSASASFDLNYNIIQDNTFKTAFTNPDNGSYTLEANYWGSNELPDGITATTWVVEDNGEYKLNTGDPLAKDIPGVLPAGTIYVSSLGNDENDGLSKETAIATLAHAVDIVKERENKTATVYVLNGEYTTDAIDISDDEGVSLSIIGQEKGGVTIHGTGAYIFDVYGDDLAWNFKNLDFDGLESTERTSAALVLYSENGNFAVDNCNFKNINTKLGAIAIGNDNGNTNITNCVIDNVTGSASSTSILTVNGDGTYKLDNIEIKNCKLDESVASSTTSSYLRSIIYVNTFNTDVTLSNSKITGNNGPMMSLIESRSNLTIENTTISDNVVNTSVNGASGGDNLIWASNDNADINITQCTITGNNIVKSGKGLFYNQSGSINVEYSDISRNTVGDFIGSTGTITADNNWWGTNDQPDTEVDKWVIMTVDVDDSDLAENNKLTLAIDFNHVNTSSGEIEELTGGEIPKESYTVEATAQKGEITPASVVVNKGEVKSQTFTVTETSDVITLTCDGDAVPITIVPPYHGIIYVDTTGSDDNEGSSGAPVATVGKAVELALVNNGSGEIIINEGTYVGNGYHVTGDLTVTGNGKVTLDANNEGRLFYMEYGDTANKIELNNLILTNATGYGAAVYSFANELILANDTIVNNNADGYLIKSNGELTITDSEISESKSGNVIQQDASGNILIKNTVFANDTVVNSTSVMAVVNINTGSGDMVIENSKFINNTARQGVIKGNFYYNIKVRGTEFINNTNTVAYGGAIYTGGGNLDITNCVFDSNKAYRSGGAIYVGYRVTATVDSCIFINNTANTMNDEYYGDAIYNGNKLTVTNSAFLGNYTNFMIYNDGEDNVVTAQNCWWGTNNDPSSMNGVGYYEDDNWEDVDCPPVDVSNWVTMGASFAPAYAQAGDEVTVTATFSNDKLPNGIPVKFTSTSGNLNTEVSTENAQASVTYTIDANDEAITATSGNETIEMPIATNIVTQSNFYSFFDEYGCLLDNVTSDELIFKGDFADLVSYITLDRPITITGDDAVLNDMGFIIAGSDVTLDKMTLVANSNLGNLIDITGENAVISNMDITYDGGDEEAVAINVASDSVKIVNNTIFFESHVAEDTEFAVGLKLTGCKGAFVDGNSITTQLPCVYVYTYDEDYYIMGSDRVNPVRLKDCEGLVFTNNIISSTTNDYSAEFPTIQAIQIIGCHDSVLDHNNISMIDEMTPAGLDIYLYGINFGYNSNVTFSNNNFNISTQGGKDAAGAAYAFQGVESEVKIIGNSITSISNGPNIGIYVASMFGGASDLIIEDNVINVTGYASSSGSWALVSGIEIQNGDAKIYNNTIYTYNVNAYDEDVYMYGISYAQWMYGDRSFDIQNNTVYTEGKYAISVIDATSLNVEKNTLCAHELCGDASVNPGSCADVNIEDNLPVNNVVTQSNFYSFFDEYGNLLDNVTSDELIFKGDFADLVSYITLDRPITITGDDAVLNDMGFIIAGNDVTLDNLTLEANSDLGNLIDIAGENAVISNNNITYVVSDPASVINVYSSANGVQILNDTIYFESSVEEYAADDVTTAICVNSGISIFDEEDPITGLVIDSCKITVVIPAFLADIYENEYYVMGISAVNGVRINGAEDFEFTNNILDVTTNRLDRTTPTFQAMYVASSSGLIDGNNISMIDEFTPEGKDACLYALELINDKDLDISNNKFDLSTAGGKEDAGTACAIVAIASDFDMVKNNITTASKGPNFAVYFPSSMGSPCDAVINGNFIKVTGLATSAHVYGLVSGIEIQTGDVKISENTIYTDNIGEYAEGNYIYGISSTQVGQTPEVEITDNTVITEGHYAVSFLEVDDAVITDNTLCAHELTGDDAVEIKDGSGNTVRDNHGYSVNQTAKDAGEWKYWSSYYNGLVDVAVSGDGGASVIIYKAKVSSNKTELVLTEVGGNIVKQGEAVLLKSGSTNITFSSVVLGDVMGDFTGNELQGVDVRTACDDILADGTFYVMSKIGDDFGFFEYTGEYMPANKAFIALAPSANNAPTRGLSFVEEKVTNIESVDSGQLTVDNWYTLSGVKLEGEPTEKGVYIYNGRKYIVQ